MLTVYRLLFIFSRSLTESLLIWNIFRQLTNDQVLVTDGTIDFYVTTVSAELYDPSTDIWTITGCMQN